MKSRLKNTLLGGGLLLQNCDPSVYPGDDTREPICPVERFANLSCKRIDAHTVFVQFQIARNLTDCDPTLQTHLYLEIDAPGDVESYQIDGPYGQRATDEKKNTPLAIGTGNTQFSGGIHTYRAGVTPIIEVLDAERKFIDHATFPSCPCVTPTLLSTCTHIDPHNHCQGTADYQFDICEATKFQVSFASQGFALARQKNNSYAPITYVIHHTNGTSTKIVANPSTTASLTLRPGEYLSVSYVSEKNLVSGSSILYLTQQGTTQKITTQVNDRDCKR